MKKSFKLGSRMVGEGFAPLVLVEMSGNHNGDINRAFAIMEAAQKAGAEAIKIQTYTPDTMTIPASGQGFDIEGGLWGGQNLYSLYGKAYTPWEWHEALFAKAKELGLLIFSTPFDESAADFLESLNAPAYKIASFECVDIPLIQKVAATGKPIIISTGMANLGEMEDAVNAAKGAGCQELMLLHCISGYPSSPAEANILTMPHIGKMFDLPVGLSDHTLSNAVAVAAVALGACLIEKHFTLLRSDGGPDAAFSLEPNELKSLIEDCHTAWQALGKVDYSRTASEEKNVVFRRSLYAVQDIAEGEEITPANVRAIRPGFGLLPKYYQDVIGKKAGVKIEKGTPLGWGMIKV